MATNWTDTTLTSSTHIRAIHLNELRSVVDKNRLVAGLGAYAWTDSPVTRVTHIRAVHFTELQAAIQDLWTHEGMGALPSWSYGSAPSTSRPISLRDTTDLRSWIQEYEDKLGPSYDPNYWGVDSCASANSMVGSQTLFDYVTQQAGAAPAFWGRYLGSLCSLTAAEVSFLHARNCRILLIYYDTTAAGVSGSYDDGRNDANAAIGEASALNVPEGTIIFADIEAKWNPSPDWIRGWSDVMCGSIYAGAGGFYANTISGNSTFNHAYCIAYNQSDCLRVGLGYIYSSEPEPGCTGAGAAPAFGPDTPPCNAAGTVAWQYAELCFGGQADEDVVNATGWYVLW